MYRRWKIVPLRHVTCGVGSCFVGLRAAGSTSSESPSALSVPPIDQTAPTTQRPAPPLTPYSDIGASELEAIETQYRDQWTKRETDLPSVEGTVFSSTPTTLGTGGVKAYEARLGGRRKLGVGLPFDDFSRAVYPSGVSDPSSTTTLALASRPAKKLSDSDVFPELGDGTTPQPAGVRPDELTEREAVRYAERTLNHADRSIMDATNAVASLDKLTTQGMLRFYQRHPINDMITEKLAIIMAVQLPDGTDHYFASDEREVMPIAKARRMAAEHGMDLIRMQRLGKQRGNPNDVALCTIGHHTGLAIELLSEGVERSGLHARAAKSLIHVPLKGSTHDFHMEVKAKEIAKKLYERYPISITMTHFGTMREGFPMLERFLQTVHKECERRKVIYDASPIDAKDNELEVMLHPTTERRPLTKSRPLTSEYMAQRMTEAQLDMELDVHVDLPLEVKDAREAIKYRHMQGQGTAWTYRSPGLGLSRARDIKVMAGFLPKGHKLYSRRGDVDMPQPYRTGHSTSSWNLNYPRESNLEQMERGASVIKKRHDLSISDMHDLGESADQPTILADYHYQMSGPAIAVGDAKLAMGYKHIGKRVPSFAPGFATMGVREPTGDEYHVDRNKTKGPYEPYSED